MAMSEISADRPLPIFLERNRDNFVELRCYLTGTEIQPTQGTIALFDGAGTQIGDTGILIATGSEGGVHFTFPAAQITSSLDFSDQYLTRWRVRIDGTDHYFTQETHIVKNKLRPVLSDTDLLKREPAIASFSADANYQDYLDEAWNQIMSRLLGMGRLPWLILSSWSLRETHMYLALHLLYMAESTFSTPDGNYPQKAEYYRKLYERSWKNLTFTYDDDRDGFISDEEKTSGAEPVIYLNQVPGKQRRA